MKVTSYKTLLVLIVVSILWGCDTYKELENETVNKKEKESVSMGKKLSAYSAFTKADIIARASSIGDITDDGIDVDVANITILDIKNAIGESVYNLSALHRSNNVNRYSHFSPWSYFAYPVIGEDYKLLQFNQPITNAALMGDFAGYNHLAIKPIMQSSNVSEGGSYSASACDGETAYFTVAYTIHLGELDYGDAASVKLVFASSDLNTTYNETGLISLSSFTKSASDRIYSGSLPISSAVGFSRNYTVYYKFYDSLGVEYLITDTNERFHFSLSVSIVPRYLNSTFAFDSNCNGYINDVYYSSHNFNSINSTTVNLTLVDFYTKYLGSYTSQKINIYVHYPASGETNWVRIIENQEYANSGDDAVLALEKDRFPCGQSVEILIRRYSIIDNPATIAY